MRELNLAGGHGFTGACGRLCLFGCVVRLHVLDLASLTFHALTDLVERLRSQIGSGNNATAVRMLLGIISGQKVLDNNVLVRCTPKADNTGSRRR